MDRFDGEYLYYGKLSPVRYGSKSKLLRYLRDKYREGVLTKTKYRNAMQSVLTLSKKIDLGTHFQRHRKKIGVFHYSLYPYKNQYFQMDLMDLSSYSKDNQGYKWILFFINAQTKYLRIRYMKSKGAEDVSIALGDILNGITDLKKSGHRVLIQCDEGSEFYNKKVKKVLQSFNSVMLYSTRSDHKAAFAESVIRTIRATLVRSMEDNGPNWIDQINQIVHNYNESYHSVIKMTPSEGERKFSEALTNIIEHQEKSQIIGHAKSLYSVGDRVRLFAENKKNHFRKGTLRKWSAELFIVSSVRKLKTKYVYKLLDEHGEPVIGTFDANDLQLGIPQSVYKFSILKTRIRDGKKEYFVHWDGYPSSDDSWVREEDLV